MPSVRKFLCRLSFYTANRTVSGISGRRLSGVSSRCGRSLARSLPTRCRSGTRAGRCSRRAGWRRLSRLCGPPAEVTPDTSSAEPLQQWTTLAGSGPSRNMPIYLVPPSELVVGSGELWMSRLHVEYDSFVQVRPASSLHFFV